MTSCVKEKMLDNSVSIGGWLQIPEPRIAKVMASCGFDWLAVDLEHGSFSTDTLPTIFDLIRAEDCLPLARVAANEAARIAQALDSGAGGVIVPMVNSVEDAEKAVAASLYPPKGRRGIGFSNASCYGKAFPNYFQEWNDSAVVVVQVEHIDAVGCMAELLAVEGVDGFVVGPYDLSGSMGITGEFENPKFGAVMEKIVDVGKKSGKVMGVHVVQPDLAQVRERVREGFTFIAYSIDSVVLWSHFSEAVASIRSQA